MKKIIILFTILFLLTGCTVKYNLNISEDGIIEKTNISDKLNNLSYTDAEKKLDSIIISNTSDGGSVSSEYEIHKIIDNETYGLEFILDDYKASTFMNGCYSNVSIIKDNDNYILQSEGQFSCFNIWDRNYDVDININVDGKVIESNADSHNGNTYTWQLENNQSKDIYIKYSLNGKIKKNNTITYIVIGSLIVLVIVIGIFLYVKNKKNNEI